MRRNQRFRMLDWAADRGAHRIGLIGFCKSGECQKTNGQDMTKLHVNS